MRHALTFTVRPGSETEVARLLSEYVSPDAHVDESTRLLRTSLFMHGNRIVRAVEVRGDLQAALRHVARQPGVRAVEDALDPHLEQERDLRDPQSARRFFTRAAMPAVHHVAARGGNEARTQRVALLYPARAGAGPELARLLARQDARPPRPRTVRSSPPPSSTATTSSYGSSTWTATPRRRPRSCWACTGRPTRPGPSAGPGWRWPSGCSTPPPPASTAP